MVPPSCLVLGGFMAVFDYIVELRNGASPGGCLGHFPSPPYPRPCLVSRCRHQSFRPTPRSNFDPGCLYFAGTDGIAVPDRTGADSGRATGGVRHGNGLRPTQTNARVSGQRADLGLEPRTVAPSG